MSKRDRDTRPMQPENVFNSVPVYVSECDIKRDQIWTAIRDVANELYPSWFRRFATGCIIAVLFCLAAAAAAISVFNHYKLLDIERQLRARSVEYRYENSATRP